MSKQPIVLITGANRGIGFHVAQHLAATGSFHVLLGSRNAAKGQEAVDAIVTNKELAVDPASIAPIQIDVTYDGSIDNAVETVEAKYGRLDILLNNAGISGLEMPGQGASLREQYHAIYNTNVSGLAVCTQKFVPLLRKSTVPGGKRIVFTSTVLASLTLTSDPKAEFPGNLFPIYRSSKTAVNMLAVHYAALLGDEGFSVCAVCPGYCETALNGYTGTKDPKEGAKAIVSAVETKGDEIHAQFMHGEADGGQYSW